MGARLAQTWFLLILASGTAGLAQPDDWPLEDIWVRGGKHYQGVMLESGKRQFEFAEIVRPRGKPMYAIIRVIDAADVSRHQSLADEQHKQLLQRFNELRNRALIEAGRMEAVQLATVERDGFEWLRYEGSWFTLLSSANEETTRRAIVRLEQIVRAYRQILPPRNDRPASFTVFLYGSSADYRASLERLRSEVEHPAFYSQEHNIIVAGTDLDRFAAELTKARQENERTRQQLRNLKASHEQSVFQAASEMKRTGFSAEEIETEVRARRAAWKDQQTKLEGAIEQADKRNAARFEEVSGAMFRRLRHEAFHAYLENYVYPHNTHDVPRWLNEGLAQVFETAQLDADTLRVDAPSRELLQRLQADLKGPRPLTLAELLSDDTSLVAAHRSDDPTRRRYLYAWGLAYHLAFERSQLGTKAFESYVAIDPKKSSPIARFERWIGRSVTEFEPQWRKEMLQLK